MKLLQINYNNQRVVVELVMYWDSCKGVSGVLGSAQLVSHVLGSRASERRIVTTEQVQLGTGVRVQL